MSSMRAEGIQHKRLKRVDWDIVQKIITFLHWNRSRKNRIALHCRMNYEYCDRYLDWCRRMKLIRLNGDGDSELIELTERGKELYRDEFECEPLDF
ncbi:MAG: winged helix-turn-helix domain-containing protein [Nitrosotalea sp.]